MATGVFGLRKVYIRQYQNVDNKNFASWPESATYGYYGSGTVNTISRLDFSSETVIDPGKNFPTARSNMGGVSSSFYGYFGGGYTSPSYISNVIRLDFSNENLTIPANNLPIGANTIGGTSTNSYGYFIGGRTSAPGTANSTISRLDFSSETIILP